MGKSDDDSTNIVALNRFTVALEGDGVEILGTLPKSLTRLEALNLAAWLVVQADRLPGHDKFIHALHAAHVAFAQANL